MPANLTPEYKKAEAEYRRAREPKKRLECLREMLRTIPKHKGTEHLQADIKTRIKELTEELAGPKRGGARKGPPQAVRPEGGAQIPLIGAPNVGKSSLLARLTGSQTEIGPYPFTTKFPIPGMLPFEDVNLQLVDLPPISSDYFEPWYVNALQTADAALLVIDLSNPACLDNILAIIEILHGKKVTLAQVWPYSAGGTGQNPSLIESLDEEQDALHKAGSQSKIQAPSPESAAKADPRSKTRAPSSEQDGEDPFRLSLPTLILANKSDLQPHPEDVQVIEELLGMSFPALPVSAQSGHGLEKLGPFLFNGLGIVRVYTKIPGKRADTGDPYTLRKGGTIRDVARLVHKDVAASLKYAKLWGSGRFQGQQVGPEHIVEDKDIIELHT